MTAPAPTVPAPFPILRVLRGFGHFCEAALGLTGQSAVLWGDRRASRPGLPYLGLRVVSGPTPSDVGFRLPLVLVPSSATLTLTAGVGEASAARVGYVEARRVRAPGESLSDHRDAFLALLDRDDHSDDWTAAASGLAGVLLTPDRVGSLRTVTARTGCTLSQVSAARAEVRQAYSFRIRATVYGVRGDPPPGTDSVKSWAATLLQATADVDQTDILRRYGIDLTSRAVATSNVGQPSGPEWEPRAAVDLFAEVMGYSHAAAKPALSGAKFAGTSKLVEGDQEVELAVDFVAPIP